MNFLSTLVYPTLMVNLWSNECRPISFIVGESTAGHFRKRASSSILSTMDAQFVRTIHVVISTIYIPCKICPEASHGKSFRFVKFLTRNGLWKHHLANSSHPNSFQRKTYMNHKNLARGFRGKQNTTRNQHLFHSSLFLSDPYRNHVEIPEYRKHPDI